MDDHRFAAAWTAAASPGVRDEQNEGAYQEEWNAHGGTIRSVPSSLYRDSPPVASGWAESRDEVRRLPRDHLRREEADREDDPRMRATQVIVATGPTSDSIRGSPQLRRARTPSASRSVMITPFPPRLEDPGGQGRHRVAPEP